MDIKGSSNFDLEKNPLKELISLKIMYRIGIFYE